MRRNSTSNDDIDSSPDDSSDDMVIISDDEINNFSDSSSISEEDIGKIFGDGSDSDGEFASRSVVPNLFSVLNPFNDLTETCGPL